jgi:hypothetical protein
VLSAIAAALLDWLGITVWREASKIRETSGVDSKTPSRWRGCPDGERGEEFIE